VWFCNFIISVWGNHCDYSPWVPKRPSHTTDCIWWWSHKTITCSGTLTPLQCVKQAFVIWLTINLILIYLQRGCNTLSTTRNQWLHKGPFCKGKNFWVFSDCRTHDPWLKTTVPYISPGFSQAPYSSTLKIKEAAFFELHSNTTHKTTILRRTKIRDSTHKKLIMFNRKFLQ
jgi:hypothetical protein